MVSLLSRLLVSPGRVLFLSVITLLFAGIVGPSSLLRVSNDGGFQRYGWNIDLSSWPNLVMDIGSQALIRPNLFESSHPSPHRLFWINTGQKVTFKNVPANGATKFVTEARVHEAWNPDRSVDYGAFRIRITQGDKEIDTILNILENRAFANQWVQISQDMSNFGGRYVDIEISPISTEQGIWTLWRKPRVIVN